MPLYKNERELISKNISPWLKKNDYNVRVGVRLKNLYDKLKSEDALSTEELNIKHPFNPDIDVLYWKRDYEGEPILNAMEVKYFRFDKNKFIRPFIYDGFGEALLLCTYGVDFVHLWNFFDPEVSSDEYWKYKNILETCLKYLRNVNYKVEGLVLPVSYKVDKNNIIDRMINILDMVNFKGYNDNLRNNILRGDKNAKIIRTLIKRGYRIVNK